MVIQHIFDNLIASINWVDAAENSYVNFHAKGVSYINLLRMDRLTVKLYMFNRVQHNAQGFMVHPHTHGYNFDHQTMVGTITNHKFVITDQDDWNLHTFMTPLNGGPGLTKIMPCGLKKVQADVWGANQGYYLDHEEIHTISFRGNYAAAVLLQYHDVNPGGPTIMFAPQGTDPDCLGGLYERMEVGTGRRLLEHYNHMLNGGEDESNVF